MTSDTAYYPKKFCQRVVQIWKQNDETTPKKVLKKFEEAREAEEINHTCQGCHSLSSSPVCTTCDPEELFDEAMTVGHELMKDIPDDDEGSA